MPALDEPRSPLNNFKLLRITDDKLHYFSTSQYAMSVIWKHIRRHMTLSHGTYSMTLHFQTQRASCIFELVARKRQPHWQTLLETELSAVISFSNDLNGQKTSGTTNKWKHKTSLKPELDSAVHYVQ